MLLRIRVRLPDRPGSLGKVARILGAAGADVVQMAVLERDGGRALDDFTVACPLGSADTGIDRLCDGLASVPGVEVVGIWPTVEPQGSTPDARVIGQLAAAREGDGLAVLTDAVPAMLSADWAGLLRTHGETGDAVLCHTSLGVFGGIELPPLEPLRPRAFTAEDGTRYAVVPIAGGELALLVARTGAPPFHRTEVFRLAQLVGAAEAVLGDRVGVPPDLASRPDPAAVNSGGASS
ncbi:ACT domain-containing protein [Thermomonospora umbrina]|uniref:ACT domain-containing protein n=1 Tax=Thermomonospora umbrina TaxID=111806 RepID=A0A3D9SH11_9ACTN|nr:ACT domain-containing protein [Thermomonospora umbrina]REE94977.1 ACT domain-containing protein [Thermomonospora umbrina]